ncbi:TPA: hypothetical protein MIX21_04185 [Klebsiella pneumoniae]|nr:Uncharacterised protein [Klebsiella pneumoniae]HBY5221563.1 hypothetical protein [Klebsiella pneumoniae]
MTVHDAIPKERGLSVSFTFLCQNPDSAGFLLSEPVTRMNNCPRRPKERGLSVSYRYLTTLGFCSVGIVESCT